MQRSRWIAVLGTVALTLLPLLVNAQNAQEPLTWAFMMKVKPGAGPQFEKAFEKYDKPLLDQLVADGHAFGWGVGYEVAGPGGYDYVIYVTMPGWAAMGEVEAAFDTRYESMSEEELKTMMEEWLAISEPGGEQTQLLRHAVFNSNPDATYNYLRLGAFTVKPGHGGDVTKMYKSFFVPIYDQLLESGVIAGYGMAEQAVHSDGSFTHESWVTFSSLADIEKYEKAFEDAEAEISDGDGVARHAAYMKMFKHEGHYDRLIRVTMRSE